MSYWDSPLQLCDTVYYKNQPTPITIIKVYRLEPHGEWYADGTTDIETKGRYGKKMTGMRQSELTKLEIGD